MRDITGYCLEGKRISDLGSFLDAFRKAGSATLSRRFHILVADEVARIVDLHRVGVGSARASDHPLRQATAAVRAKHLPSLDCVLRLAIVGDALVVGFVAGERTYGKCLSTIEGLKPISVADQSKIGSRERSRREALAAAAADAGFMTVRLLDQAPPKLRASSIPALVPERNVRLNRTASHLLWLQSPFRTASDNEGFKRWLRGEGSRTLKATVINVDREIPIGFDKEDLTLFGERRQSRVAPKKRTRKPMPDTPTRPVDHADVIRSNDGRTIVAVWSAGFSPRDRIMLQLFETTLSFTQAGRDFGQIVEVPSAAVAALRSGDEIHVVEIRRQDNKTEVVGTHAAILLDRSSDSDYLSTAQNWHARPAHHQAQGTTGIILK